ncbi:hypothetical protein P168DRAFT_179090 [Aspergillus campestris IBT 28561]|uniref:Uncharacterized protein n=1 Tax=Aspergillus campestris (strain IBT 28561) TaxID=1392248 RepID=A0A2I1CZX9_ASPC2|nr:uncharacterized protein P168DRAFT_179090 [Aspergillus campestris IBT 28561]PKY03180.1 hypothetical protein P168DRAFT_179090 [Aspergillus campestris IBT 28561]
MQSQPFLIITLFNLSRDCGACQYSGATHNTHIQIQIQTIYITASTIPNRVYHELTNYSLPNTNTFAREQSHDKTLPGIDFPPYDTRWK